MYFYLIYAWAVDSGFKEGIRLVGSEKAKQHDRDES